VGIVIQDMPQINQGSQPRWDRFERADLFEQYRELRTQGISERQAAKELKVPRTTLQAWRLWHDTLDSSFRAALDWRSYSDWSLPSILPVSKSARAAFALCVSSST
jgi:hypothetical protein